MLSAFDGLGAPRTRESPHDLNELLPVALCAVTSAVGTRVDAAAWESLKCGPDRHVQSTLPRQPAGGGTRSGGVQASG